MSTQWLGVRKRIGYCWPEGWLRNTKDFGLECIVIGDACATKDLEINGEQVKAKEVQKSFLAAFNYFYSEVLTTEKFLEN